MKFTTFVSSALLAIAAFAAPQSENALKKRNNLSSDGQAGAVIKPDSGKSFNRVGGSKCFPSHFSDPNNFDQAKVSISEVDVKRKIFLTLKFPIVVKVPGLSGTGESAVSIWIGIDALDATAKIDAHTFQTGIDVTMASDGSITYQAWYEWFPNVWYFSESDFPIAENDGEFFPKLSSCD